MMSHEGEMQEYNTSTPYDVIKCHPKASSYTLNMPNSPNMFVTFYISELKCFMANNPALFPSRELMQPGPILTKDGMEEFLVEEIIDSRQRRHSWQYLVRWAGYGPEHNKWLLGHELEDCKALDVWLGVAGGSGYA